MPGINGLDFQPRPIPFVAGLNTKGNKQAKNPPALDICDDLEFDDVGGVRTRLPMGAVQSNIFGGGTISNARRMFYNGTEQCLFTSDALYSWNAQLSKWVRKGTHLAISSDESIRFATTGDQVSCDRAELNNTVVFAWTDLASTSVVYAAAYDKTTGSTLMAPTLVATGLRRTRLVALSTKILLFFASSAGDLSVKVIDPADPATGIAAAATVVLASPNFNQYYDVVRVPGADTAIGACRRTTTTSYTIFKVTSAAAVTTATPARSAEDAIGVSCDPTGTSLQVVRTTTTAPAGVRGDLITISSLADVTINQAIGTYTTGVNQVACAHRSVQNGGAYRCYVWWSQDEEIGAGTGAAMLVKQNWVDTAGALGTQASFMTWCGIASRAFDYNGSVYVHLVFDAYGEVITPARQDVTQLQGIYLLYRDDAFLSACSRSGNAWYAAAQSCLPGVALVNGSTGFAWCGSYVRATGTTVTIPPKAIQRAPRDITFTFDANSARRTTRIGEALYISGSPLLMYDGQQLVELGWLVAPYRFLFADSGAGGALSAGDYYYRSTVRWRSATGETDRSTWASSDGCTVAVSHFVSTSAPEHGRPIWMTRKANAALEYWRSLVNPAKGAPYYLASGTDPANVANPNRYCVNDTTLAQITIFQDGLSDGDLAIREELPENGGTLEAVTPPPARLICASPDRVFLAGVAGAPDDVWYSKTKELGKVVQFNDGLTFQVPREGGNITAIEVLDGTIIVWRETATYAFVGSGFDNTGGGQNYGPARVLSYDLGAISQEGIALDDEGVTVKTSKGWFLLDKALAYHYIGADVSAYDAESVLATHVMTSRHQIRILTSARMLVLDTLVDQWSRWTIGDGLHAAIGNGVYSYLTSSGPRAEQSTYTGVDYGFDLEIAWAKLADLHGIGIVRLIQLLGIWQSAHRIRVRIARDYKSDGAGGWSYFYDKIWTPNNPVVGGPERVQFGPSQNRMGAIKIRLTAMNIATSGAPDGAACSLTGLVLDAAVERGVFTNLAAAAKQ